MTTPPALPAWPEPLKFPLLTSYAHDIEKAYLHQRQLAEAWEARARLAVEALEQCRLSQRDSGYLADEALATIGPLPPLPPTETKERGAP